MRFVKEIDKQRASFITLQIVYKMPPFAVVRLLVNFSPPPPRTNEEEKNYVSIVTRNKLIVYVRVCVCVCKPLERNSII